jgi:hypothetical protein
LKNTFCEQWNYLYSRGYGSSEYSVKKPGIAGHDPVEIRSLQLIEEGSAIFVEIPQLHPVMQLHLYMDLKSAGGKRSLRIFTIQSYRQAMNRSLTFPATRTLPKSLSTNFQSREVTPATSVLWLRNNLAKVPRVLKLL